MDTCCMGYGQGVAWEVQAMLLCYNCPLKPHLDALVHRVASCTCSMVNLRTSGSTAPGTAVKTSMSAPQVSIGSDAVDAAEDYLRTGRKTGETSIEQISWVRLPRRPCCKPMPHTQHLHTLSPIRLGSSKQGRHGAEPLHACPAWSAGARAVPCDLCIWRSHHAASKLASIPCLTLQRSCKSSRCDWSVRLAAPAVAGVRSTGCGGVHRPSQGVCSGPCAHTAALCEDWPAGPRGAGVLLVAVHCQGAILLNFAQFLAQWDSVNSSFQL